MDGVTNDDYKARQGVRFLHGDLTDHSKTNILHAKKAGKAHESDIKRHKSDDAPAQKASGLDLGRRLLVVLKPVAGASSHGSGVQGSQVIRVVDHGINQKEAIRRLADAQVLLQSYEDQLQDRDVQINQVQLEFKRVMRVAGGDKLRDPALVKALGLTEDQLIQEGIVPEEYRSGAPRALTAQGQVRQGSQTGGAGSELESVPRQPGDPFPEKGLIGKFEAVKDSEHEDKKWQEQQDVERKHQAAVEEATEKGLRPPPPPEPPKDDDVGWYTIPFWLREDEMSRKIVTAVKKSMISDFSNKNRLDQTELSDHMWQVGLQLAQRWAGVPDEDVLKRAEMLDKQNKHIQRQALQESSMLRQHIKRLERKYAEVHNNAQKMQKAMATMAGQLKEARDTAAMFGVEAPSGTGVGAKTPGGAKSGGIVAASFGGGGPSSGGSAAARKSGGAGKNEASSHGQAGAQNLLAGVDLGPGEGRIGEGGLYHGHTFGSMDFGNSLAAAQGRDKGVVQGLFGDDSLDIVADQEQLEEMDHELFEPLDQFDDDLKDLMIDAINEKVRRILSLDPSKYKNGRLPFGLKPYGNLFNEGVDYETEYFKLKELYDQLQEDYNALLKQLETAKAAAERWKHKYQDLAEKQGPVSQNTEEGGGGRSLGRGKAPPKDEEEEREEKEAVVLVQKGKSGISKEEMDRLLAEQAKGFQKQIAALEKRIKDLEAEVEALKAKKQKEKKEKDEEEEVVKVKKQKEVPEEVEKKPKKKKEQEEEEKPPPAPKNRDAELLAVIQTWEGANRATMDTLLRTLKKFASITTVLIPEKIQTEIQGFIISKEPDAQEVAKAMKYAGPKLEAYIAEALEKYKESCTPPPGEPQQVHLSKPKPQAETIVEKEIVYQGDPDEVMNLKNQLLKHQNEISKLLLTIDELRKRLEMIGTLTLDAPPGVAGAVDGIMDQVGLKELMTAGTRGPPVLKGVFERLYQDAVQRIQRYGMIRDQMLLANKAYQQVADAISQSPGFESAEDDSMDFERLSATTNATIRGMWYHTEYLFRRACEYAMSSGVEASLLRNQQRGLNDSFDMGLQDGSGGYGQESYKVQKARERLPARRSDRPGREPAVSRSPPAPASHGAPAPGAGAPPSPARFQKPRADGSEPTPFTSYIAALREARGDSPKDGWTKMEKKLAKSDLVDGGFNPKTLKGAVADSLKSLSSSPPLGASRSLPALPKQARGGLMA
eukprot:TRINITY_DN25606_c0_g2_i1.p1 TRINITY_DN25606_c0_g2~~TRINITY_DN25606_c0_g2_i1.p1  ORF type:complete len:1219 (-),score=344.00 TRINITY_DN25606_c0_g2_i1:511-4167(-)